MDKIGNYGGCILNPPEHCKKRFKARDGSIWCDLGYCQSGCERHCDHYIKWSKMKQPQRRAWLIEQGVNLPPWNLEEAQEEPKEVKEWEKQEPEPECKYKRRSN